MNHTIITNLESDNIGSFIGKGGINLKKIITCMKKNIIGKNSEISKEEWDSVKISIKLEKVKNTVIANIYCDESNISQIRTILFKYVDIHNKEYRKYLSKKEAEKTQEIIFEIGITSNMFQITNNIRYKLSELKNDLSKIPMIYDIKDIKVIENIDNSNSILIGEKSIFNIGIILKIKGEPELKYVKSVVKNYYDRYKTKNENTFVPIYRWDCNIGKDVTYGLYTKTAIVSPIPRCVSC